MKNAFNRFISRLEMAKERVSVLEDVSIEIPQASKQTNKNKREWGGKKQNRGTGKIAQLG